MPKDKQHMFLYPIFLPDPLPVIQHKTLQSATPHTIHRCGTSFLVKISASLSPALPLKEEITFSRLSEG